MTPDEFCETCNCHLDEHHGKTNQCPVYDYGYTGKFLSSWHPSNKFITPIPFPYSDARRDGEGAIIV